MDLERQRAVQAQRQESTGKAQRSETAQHDGKQKVKYGLYFCIDVRLCAYFTSSVGWGHARPNPILNVNHLVSQYIF